MPELLITSSIDPIAVPHFETVIYPEKLPLHVTVWQSFFIQESNEALFTEELGESLEGFSPLEIIGTHEDYFGPNRDVLVRRIMALGSGATLITLHAVIGGLIERYDGIVRNPEWAYENYNPHVAYVHGRELEEGEYRKLSSVELLEKDHKLGTKTLKKVWELTDV